MIVRSQHFEFDRDGSREVARLATDQTLSEEQRELINEAGADQPFFTQPSSHCFYCGEKLTIPAVMWNGRDSKGANVAEIWLHPKCAEHFCARVSRDVNELKIGKPAADEQLREWKIRNPRR